MELNLNQLKEAVAHCGGNPILVEEWIHMMETNPITHLWELQSYIDKMDYSYIIREKAAPNLREWLEDVCFERYQTIDLDYLLERIADDIMDEDDYVYNKEDDKLSAAEIVERYRPDIAQELIDLKFGSMCYDW